MNARWPLLLLHIFSFLIAGCEASPPAEEVPKGQPAGTALDLHKLVPPELQYVRIDLPANREAFVRWKQAISSLVPPDDSPALKEAWNDYRDSGVGFPEGEPGRLLGEYLDRNREAIGQLVSAANQERWQFPAITEGAFSDTSYLLCLRSYEHLRQLEANREISRGSPGAAALSFMDMLRVSDRVRDAEGGINAFMHGCALQRAACEGMISLAVRDDVPVATLEKMITTLSPRPSMREEAAKALRMEFCCVLLHHLVSCERFMEWCRDDTIGPVNMGPVFEELYHSADLEGTVRFLAGFYGRWMSNLLRPWPDRDQSPSDDWQRARVDLRWDGDRLEVLVKRGIHTTEDLVLAKTLLLVEESTPGSEALPLKEDRALWARMITKIRQDVDHLEASPTYKADRLMLARMILTMDGPPVEQFVQSFHRSLAEREGTHLVVAIRLYAARKGRIPGALQELVEAKILSSIPIDPFSGKPMLYSPGRQTVWSVGPDGVDDGGDGDWSRNGKDIVFRIIN